MKDCLSLQPEPPDLQQPGDLHRRSEAGMPTAEATRPVGLALLVGVNPIAFNDAANQA